MTVDAPERPRRVALVGSPNAGKTSVFNALTGLRSRAANYPGVTVSRREADVTIGESELVLIDLPGTYDLEPISPDEEVVVDALRGAGGVPGPDALIIVADATTLDRSLFLIAQFLELDLPAALVVTMVDEVAARGGTVDLERLSAALGIPVVGVVGHRGIGVPQVRELLTSIDEWERPFLPPPPREDRTAWVDSIVESVVTPLAQDRRSRRIDAVLLHPLFGPIVFVVVMLVFFQSIFTVATPAVDLLDQWFTTLGERVDNGTLGGRFVSEAVIGGVGGVLSFVPQIAMLFGIIGLLERVGYLSRAALLADRLMSRFGMEGRSFVAMLSSFACAVPGIMATRTIPDERQRIATMLSAPLMTCSARLPVFTLLVGAFVPDQAVIGPLRSQGLAMFGLYFLGGMSGLLFSALLSRSVLSGTSAPFIMELPPYRWPTGREVLQQVWDGAWSFIRKAGTIVLATTVGLWVLLNVPSVEPPPELDPPAAAAYQMEHSAAGTVGKALEPVFSPLGFDWRTNVAVLGSLAAREVFVSTLAVTTAAESDDSLPDRLAELRRDDGTKVFDAGTVAALMIFFVYALQCFATIAVLRRESNSWRWPAVAVGSMFVVAYVGAFLARVIVGALV